MLNFSSARHLVQHCLSQLWSSVTLLFSITFSYSCSARKVFYRHLVRAIRSALNRVVTQIVSFLVSSFRYLKQSLMTLQHLLPIFSRCSWGGVTITSHSLKKKQRRNHFPRQQFQQWIDRVIVSKSRQCWNIVISSLGECLGVLKSANQKCKTRWVICKCFSEQMEISIYSSRSLWLICFSLETLV